MGAEMKSMVTYLVLLLVVSISYSESAFAEDPNNDPDWNYRATNDTCRIMTLTPETLRGTSAVTTPDTAKHAREGVKSRVTLRVGTKTADEKSAGATSGWTAGITLDAPFSDHWGVQFEFNYWRARDKQTQNDLGLRELGVLVDYGTDLKPLRVSFSLGVGIADEGVGNRAFVLGLFTGSPLLTANALSNVGYKMNESLWLIFQIRKQFAGSVSPGGGNSYAPWLFETGIQFHL